MPGALRNTTGAFAGRLGYLNFKAQQAREQRIARQQEAQLELQSAQLQQQFTKFAAESGNLMRKTLAQAYELGGEGALRAEYDRLSEIPGFSSLAKEVSPDNLLEKLQKRDFSDIEFSSDVGKLMQHRIGLLESGVPANHPRVQQLDEMLNAIKTRNSTGFRNQAFQYYLSQNNGNTAGAIEDMVALEGRISQNRSLGTTAGGPLPASINDKLTAMRTTLNVAAQLKSEFTPDEIANYQGFFSYPANQVAQIINEDPKFARFQLLVNRAKLAAFSAGGKQLTPFEASVVFGHVPTGSEFSAADFTAKLDDILDRTPTIVRDTVNFATMSRGEARERFAGEGPVETVPQRRATTSEPAPSPAPKKGKEPPPGLSPAGVRAWKKLQGIK